MKTAHALAYVQPAIFPGVKPMEKPLVGNGSKLAREKGNADLAAVRMSAQHQIPVVSEEERFAVGIVAEDDARDVRRRGLRGKGSFRKAFAIPEVSESDELEPTTVKRDFRGVVMQAGNAASLEQVTNLAAVVQARASGGPDATIVIAEHSEGGNPNGETAEDIHVARHDLIVAGDKIASDAGEVRFESDAGFDGTLEVFKAGGIRHVQIRQMKKSDWWTGNWFACGDVAKGNF